MWLLLVLFATTPVENFASNILVVVPIPVRSHNILLLNIAEALATRGHNVTFMSNSLPSKEIANMTQIHLPVCQNETLAKNNVNLFEIRKFSPLKKIMLANNYGITVSDSQLSSIGVKNLINSNSTFAVVIAQAMLSDSVLAGLSYRFQAPAIGVSNLQPNLWSNYLVGNLAPTSFAAHPFMNLPTKMNFWQRVQNFIGDSLASMHFFWFSIPQHQEIFTKHFGINAPPIMDILKNTSVVLVNDHFSLSYPRLLPPNMISIGGAHIAPTKPLPPDLQHYMDSAKHGAILFSMGSILEGSLINKERIEIFFKVFSKLKENVLWKYEKDLPGKPANVRISKWLPQNDLMGHPNLKLFITHGGILSTIESTFYGVPVVGIPVFGDQSINMKNTVRAGTGLYIDYDTITAEGLYDKIQRVLNNPKYRNAAQQQSKIFKDQPMTALETAIWWIEYVIRYKGLGHLRLAAQDLEAYEIHQIDVIIFLSVIILTTFWVLLKIFVWMRCVWCRHDNMEKSLKVD